jgi:hypothetical protein
VGEVSPFFTISSFRVQGPMKQYALKITTNSHL